MTHDPRLPTLEEIMNNNPFAIVDSPWGHIEAWRASTLATGTMGALSTVYDAVRNDAATTAQRVAALDATKEKMQQLCDMIDNLHKRMDAHAAQMEAFELKRRADEEQEAAAAREFEEPIELPPDFDDASPFPPPEPPGPSKGDEVFAPSGDLHSLASKEPEEPLPVPESDDMGGVPLSYKEVPTSYVHDEDQTEFALPEPEMTTDARRKPKGSVVSQPVSVSLNKA